MNMKTHFYSLIAVIALGTPAFAGDAAKGEKNFKTCKACHTIAADDGTLIVRGGKTGPNLYGVIGRKAGSTDYRYGDSMTAAGAAGLIWNEANLSAYIANPKAFLVEITGDAAAKSKMSFKLVRGGDDMAAYLASIAPASN
jgi:cytochrome c